MLDVDEQGRVERIYTVLASRKLEQLDFTRLRGVSRLEELFVRAARFVVTRLQRPEQRLSKHIQVHARSRVRPGTDATDPADRS